MPVQPPVCTQMHAPKCEKVLDLDEMFFTAFGTLRLQQMVTNMSELSLPPSWKLQGVRLQSLSIHGMVVLMMCAVVPVLIVPQVPGACLNEDACTFFVYVCVLFLVPASDAKMCVGQRVVGSERCTVRRRAGFCDLL